MMLKNEFQDESLNKWKRKYVDSLNKTDALEKELRSRIEVLANGLSDVCNYGDELYPRLGREWSALKKVTRKFDDENDIIEPIRDLTEALHNQATETRSARRNATTALLEAIEQLLSLDPPTSSKRNLRQLKKSLSGERLDEIELAGQIGRYTEQLQETLTQLGLNKRPTKRSFAAALFGKADKSQLETTPESIKTGHTAVTDAKTGDASPSSQPIAGVELAPSDTQNILEALKFLLDQLDIPKPLSNDAQQLQSRLQQGIEWADLDEYLMTLFELALASVEWHYLQFGDFLEQVNSQIASVQHFLEEAHKLSRKLDSNRTQLRETVGGLVTSIEQSLSSGDKVESIKNIVRDKTRAIASALNEFENVAKTHVTSWLGDVQLLGDKLQGLESQSQTARVKLESKTQLARLDNITQLPNRSTYDERVQFEYSRWQRYKHPLSIIIGDIDHFKNFNEEYGHMAGDTMLKLVAQSLKSGLRQTDFVARYGGEKFAVLLPDTEAMQAEKVAEKLRQRVSSIPFSRRGEAVRVTMSFGISELVEGDTKDTLYERANEALYYAKDHGRNRCCSA